MTSHTQPSSGCMHFSAKTETGDIGIQAKMNAKYA